MRAWWWWGGGALVSRTSASTELIATACATISAIFAALAGLSLAPASLPVRGSKVTESHTLAPSW